jgi:hypothetical protein
MEERKIKQDFILLIMNCQKYREKAETQTNTWLKELPPTIKYYHVVGNSMLKTNFKFDDEERKLWVRNHDDYNSLPHKVITAYDAINQSYDYKYIMKTDDDQQVLSCFQFFTTLTKLFESPTFSYNYGGFIVDVKLPHISQYYRIHPELPRNLKIEAIKYCNGRFYFLSSNAVQDLINKREDISKEYLEDYAVGYYLNSSLKQNIFPIKTDVYFKDFTP